jgi:hypothetical protein
VTVGTTWMRHNRFNPLPGLQPIGATHASRWQGICRRAFGRDNSRDCSNE